MIFFRKALDFVKQHGFDGLDLDYEFPDASDKVNFAEWVKDIKTVFEPEGYEVNNYIYSKSLIIGMTRFRKNSR